MPENINQEGESSTNHSGKRNITTATVRRITPDQIDANFMEEVLKMPDGDKIHSCFQCGVCSGSCPVLFAMDYTPRQISEMIHIGLRKAVLSSATIWLCSTCYMCYERCPQGVKLTDVFNAIKIKAVEEGYPTPQVYEKMSRQLLKNGFVYDMDFANDERETLGLPEVKQLKQEIIVEELKDTLIFNLLGERKEDKKKGGGFIETMNSEHALSANAGSENHRYSLFIGCTIPIRENNYEASARAVAKALGIEIVEIPGQSCCGLPFRSIDYNAWLTLAARNLAIASKSDSAPIMVLCSGCYKSLLTVSKELEENTSLRQNISKRLSVEGLEANGGVKVRHIAQVLHDDYGIENIRKHVKEPLTNLRVAIHPGCHITMPSKIIGFDNPASPKKLNRLVEVIGAQLVDYETKRLCCGATIIGIKEDVSKALVRRKIENITGRVDAIVTFCPICHATYDIQQLDVFTSEREKQVPVLHYTQLLGLAMGLPEEKLGFDLNRVDASGILGKTR